MAWLRIKDTAKYCGVSTRTIRTWMHQTEGLKYCKLGSIILIKQESIDQFLEKHMVESSSQNQIDEIVENTIKSMV